MKIYGDTFSGNCYKIQLVCHLLNLDYEWQDVSILQGETQTPEYLDKNPNGKVPMLELSDGTILVESNAIINYLAFDTPLYPHDRMTQARILQWQFFEQYSHEPFIAVARFIKQYLGMPEDRRADFESKQPGGKKALQIMNQHLHEFQYFAGDSLTTADISLFAYTHVADEGGFDLSAYPGVQDWIVRIQQSKGFVKMASA